ncbi:Arc family DNA-binding protein [bacterium]|nr:Arc family DNA-binding protein [bacterium]
MKTINPYPLRIEEELMTELKKIAEKNSRSVNKEVEFLIKKRIEEDKNSEKKTKSTVKS